MAKNSAGASDPPLKEQIGQKAHQASQAVHDQAEQVGQKVHEQTEQVKQQANQAVQQGQQFAVRAWDTGRSQFRSMLTSQKESIATRLDDVVQVLRTTGGQLHEQGQAGGGQIAERLADRVGQVASTVHEKEIEEILADTEDFARSKPVVFLSIAAVLGLLLARFLKSSGKGLATGRA